MRARSEARDPRAEPTQRQLRVAEQMRHLIAEALLRGEIRDPRLQGRSVTIAEVRVSRDLRHARVFATELGKPLSAEAAAALARAAPWLGGHLARAMHLKFAPKLEFVADTLFERADRVERLLADERARLGSRAGEEEHEPQS
ncbi:MAG: 30S ribosome-binding factor RbfA [Geminicoccaceae bacterium]|nr:30S ribosome-binding factor RbfA [Geminicoccaceae bacterium]MDW8340496.1 30S ribosome-binding factor RbfA [Geminicoccaceae bacterium]